MMLSALPVWICVTEITISSNGLRFLVMIVWMACTMATAAITVFVVRHLIGG